MDLPIEQQLAILRQLGYQSEAYLPPEMQEMLDRTRELYEITGVNNAPDYTEELAMRTRKTPPITTRPLAQPKPPMLPAPPPHSAAAFSAFANNRRMAGQKKKK